MVINDKEYIIYKNMDLRINDLFLVNNSRSFDECIDYLSNSYASAFSYDIENNICYFKIIVDHTKSSCNLNMNMNDIIHKINSKFITVFKKQVITNGLICPTYINHLKYFIILCKSLHYIMDKISFVIIFSSLKEAVTIMESVSSILNEYKNIEVVSLIYDVTYSNTNKFNYQCAKKLWGLEILNYDNLILLDSDFEFINPINIFDEIRNNGNTLHITQTKEMLIHLDKTILNNINNLLNINSNYFPLDLYWNINKELFSQFLSYLGSRIPNMNYNDYILNNDSIYFEIIMYKLYLHEFFPERLTIIDYTNLSNKYKTYFLWDMKLNNEEMSTYKANIAIAKYVNTNKEKYLIRIHNDR